MRVVTVITLVIFSSHIQVTVVTVAANPKRGFVHHRVVLERVHVQQQWTRVQALCAHQVPGQRFSQACSVFLGGLKQA